MDGAKRDAARLEKEVGQKLMANAMESKPWWIGITQEGRVPRRYDGARIKSKQFSSKQNSRNRAIYLSEFNWVKNRIPRPLTIPAIRKIAQEKISRIHSDALITQVTRDVLVPQKDGKMATKKRTLKYVDIPCRFENLAHVVSELSKSEMFVGKEALLSSSPAGTIPRDWPIDPTEDYRKKMFEAERDTNWSHGIYDCKVVFDPTAFERNTHWNIKGWGSVKPIGYSNVWGVQIFDPDPKKLLELAKAMAKRRPKDPLVIFDLYGNVFYP